MAVKEVGLGSKLSMESYHQELEELVRFIRGLFAIRDGSIHLHEPTFIGREKEYILDALETTLVSTSGNYIDRFELELAQKVGARFAVATVNGTAALHTALILAGVKRDEQVITQPLTFVATCNAVTYQGAEPLFIDVDKETLGLSAAKLADFLKNETSCRDGGCYSKRTGKRISACLPMHTFGFPLDILKVVEVCDDFQIPVVEDAAESLGSSIGGKHTGTFGLLGAYSLNGNKTITSGGGGVIVTNDKQLAEQAKHLTTTAKVKHSWDYNHDEIGYNYRMPNINAALACAQLEMLDNFVEKKRDLAGAYQKFMAGKSFQLVTERPGTKANSWLNTVLCMDRVQRDELLEYTNRRGILTRPVWKLMSDLSMYRNCQSGNLNNARWLEERIVNVPSSVIANIDELQSS